FTYESEQFDPEMHEYVRERLRVWMDLYGGIFERLALSKITENNVIGQNLTEMLATIFEGGLLLGRALDDRYWLIRQLQQFRRYLQLEYGD
ncbi:MAG: hypothetical protein ACR2P6_06565, partial [Gammaproteobacteria bacterium]